MRAPAPASLMSQPGSLDSAATIFNIVGARGFARVSAMLVEVRR
jgi:hypothetical protein